MELYYTRTINGNTNYYHITLNSPARLNQWLDLLTAFNCGLYYLLYSLNKNRIKYYIDHPFSGTIYLSIGSIFCSTLGLFIVNTASPTLKVLLNVFLALLNYSLYGEHLFRL